jgi:hypothetical protein
MNKSKTHLVSVRVAYEREMLDDDLLYITTRFERLEAMIRESKEPLSTLPKKEEKKTLFDNIFKK